MWTRPLLCPVRHSLPGLHDTKFPSLKNPVCRNPPPPPYLIQNGVSINMQAGSENVYCDDKWLEFIIGQIIINNAVKYKKKTARLSPSVHKNRSGKQFYPLRTTESAYAQKNWAVSSTKDLPAKQWTAKPAVYRNRSLSLQKLSRKLLNHRCTVRIRNYTNILLIFPMAANILGEIKREPFSAVHRAVHLPQGIRTNKVTIFNFVRLLKADLIQPDHIFRYNIDIQRRPAIHNPRNKRVDKPPVKK